MSKYKCSWGFAIAPEKDMKMLENMSKKGWHLEGMSGIRYRFEKGECHEYIYDFNMEEKVEEGMLSFYESSGWKLIFSDSGFQVFRAEKGTIPLFTDNEYVLFVYLSNADSRAAKLPNSQHEPINPWFLTGVTQP